MSVLFFVPIELIIVFGICLLAIGYLFVQSFTEILFGVVAVFLFFYGIYITIKGIVILIKREIGYGIVEIFRGIFISIICMFVAYFLEIGCGHSSFENTQYVLVGRFEMLDINMASLLISLFLIFIVSVPVMITKKKGKNNIIKYVSIVLIMISYISIYNMGLQSEFNNSYASFNWENPGYEVIQDTNIMHEDFFSNLVKTGTFKEGTLLYKNDFSRKIDGVRYLELTDGEKVGYVSCEDLKELVIYIVNHKSSLYKKVQKKITAMSSGKGKTESTISCPSEEVISTIDEGTIVTLTGTQYKGYFLIRLEDGTEGFINRKYIDEKYVDDIRE